MTTTQASRKRKYYDGYGITELRRYAREMKIVGRSKMDGYELLAACRKGWDARRAEKEQALLTAGPVVPGTLLKFKSCDCVIRVTSDVQTLLRYGALFVRAEYVSLCDRCQRGRPTNINYLNKKATGTAGYGEPYKFMLYQHVHVAEQLATASA